MSKHGLPIRVTVFASDAELLLRVREVLSDIAELTVADTIAALSAESSGAHCILLVSSILTAEELGWVRDRAASGRTYIPLVLVTGARPQTLDEVDQLSADDKVLIKYIETELRPAVRRQALRVIAADIIDESLLPPMLINAFRAACYDQPPPRFLKALASRLGTDSKSLWREYGRAMAGRPKLRLEDLHEAIVVIRCLGWKSPQRRWDEVAEINQLTVRWLREAVRRQTQLSLRDLDDPTIEHLQFDWLLSLLHDRFGRAK